jgi:Xaa-Pro dipeptidase
MGLVEGIEHEVGGYPAFSDEELARRRARVRDAMREDGIEALLAYGTSFMHNEVQWLSGFPVSWEAILVFALEGDSTLRIEFYNHIPNARLLARDTDVQWLTLDPGAAIAEDLAARGLGGGRIGFAGPWTVARHGAVRAALPKAEAVDFNPRMGPMRLTKSDEELAFIRYAAQLTDASMEALERDARPGMTEHELAAVVQGAYLGRGGRNIIHFLGATPMEDPSMCVPRQHQMWRPLQVGDVMLTEITAHFYGYMGQSLRPYAIGTPPTEEYRRMYDVAVEAFDRVTDVLRPGATISEVLDQGDFIHDEGFIIHDDILHGFNASWTPILWTRQMRPEPPLFEFVEGMTVVVQPAIATEDRSRGVQVGEMVRIGADGAERLHSYPMRFVECG